VTKSDLSARLDIGGNIAGTGFHASTKPEKIVMHGMNNRLSLFNGPLQGVIDGNAKLSRTALGMVV
jgi:hypothetical protein